MICKRAEFIDFRNIENEQIEFSDGINVIHGENAQGKTNIVEGIYIFARGKSFRAYKDKELIKFGSDIAYTKLFFKKNDVEKELGVEIIKNGPKHFYINRVRTSRTADIIGDFRAVLFCPSHLGIIKESPSVRRRFIDVAISQLHPIYIKLLSKYKTVLENRNAVLKMSSIERAQYGSIMDVYNEELAYLCADISEMRNEYVKKLDARVKDFFEDMSSGKEKPDITYETNAEEEDFTSHKRLVSKYYRLFTENTEKEIRNASTLYGIHKDDLKTEINKRDAKYYSSQGQQRSFALAMKLAEGEISREITSEYPVFLLDDVLSELDLSRRKYVMSNIYSRQVIITSCEPGIFESGESVNFINIKNGRINTQDGKET